MCFDPTYFKMVKIQFLESKFLPTVDGGDCTLGNVECTLGTYVKSCEKKGMSRLQKSCKYFLKSRNQIKDVLQKYLHHTSKEDCRLATCFSRKYSTYNDAKIVKSIYPDIEIPNNTYTELIWNRYHKWEDRDAVECGITGEVYTYGELRERSESIRRGLLNEGLKPGDVLAFLLPNTPDYIAAILGATDAGLTICSINPLYTPDEIAYQLKNSDAKCIITFPDKIGDVMKATEKLSSEKQLPTHFQVFSMKGFNDKERRLPNLQPFGSRYSLPNDLTTNINGQTSGHGQVSKPLSQRLAFISHSSGTTGLPKGVCLTHQNVTASLVQMAARPMSVFQDTTRSHQDIIPMVLPIFHNFGLEMIIDSLYHGSKIVTLPKFDDKTFLSTIRIHKATILFLVPPMLLFLGSKSEATKEHLQHVRCIFSAAAPVGESDILKCLKKASPKANFIQGYGLTEGMCLLTQTPYGVRNLKSVGIPMVNTEIKIVDRENGSSKTIFETGEVCFRGPQMTPGYLNNTKATEESIDNEGWFHTGDVGYFDEDGYLYIVDRIKDMIKVKGFQVAPAELEAILRSHPGVADVGVTSMPDDRKGEVPVAFVKTLCDISDKDLKEFLSDKVAPFKMIEKYIFVDSIPKSPSGKILRKQLKQMI